MVALPADAREVCAFRVCGMSQLASAYTNVIPLDKQVDLSVIAKRVNKLVYAEPSQFVEGMNLMFNNCFTFNKGVAGRILETARYVMLS